MVPVVDRCCQAKLLSMGLDATQVHYGSSYSAVELRMFHCECVRKMPLLGPDLSMLIGFLFKTGVDWIDLRLRVAEVRVTYDL